MSGEFFRTLLEIQTRWKALRKKKKTSQVNCVEFRLNTFVISIIYVVYISYDITSEECVIEGMKMVRLLFALEGLSFVIVTDMKSEKYQQVPTSFFSHFHVATTLFSPFFFIFYYFRLPLPWLRLLCVAEILNNRSYHWKYWINYYVFFFAISTCAQNEIRKTFFLVKYFFFFFHYSDFRHIVLPMIYSIATKQSEQMTYNSSHPRQQKKNFVVYQKQTEVNKCQTTIECVNKTKHCQ